jgi:hypothetical protein
MTAILILLALKWGGFHRILFIPDFTKVSQSEQGWKTSAKPCTQNKKKYASTRNVGWNLTVAFFSNGLFFFLIKEVMPVQYGDQLY